MDDTALKRELQGLFAYVQRVRQEIAGISHPADEDYHFANMGDELDLIVTSTAEASDTIMSKVEENDALVNKLRASIKDPGVLKILEEIAVNHTAILEACAFQDLTGQRVSKVAKSITYVDDKVSALTRIWGEDEIQKTEVKGTEKSEDEKLLHGPQDPQKAISQSEIDALFD